MLYRTNYPAPMYPAAGLAGVPPRPDPRRSGRKQIVLNILSILVALFAVYEVLGISEISAPAGLSNDDAAIAAENSAWKLLFDPAGFALLLGLLISAFVIHRVSKSMLAFSNAATLTGLIVTGLAFVLSLFRVSILFPILFGGIGMVSNTIQNGPDVRTPVAEEFVLEPAQLIQYNDASGVRISSALANHSLDSWQTATLAISYADAAGTPCGVHEQIEDYLAPGQQRTITTGFLSAAVYYSDPSCVPVTAAAELTSIDVDSRSQIPPADYNRAAPVFDALTTVEDPWMDESVVKLSVAGTVAAESLAALQDPGRLPVGFEVADAQGLRLSSCFTADDLGPGGSFATGNFHSPISPGIYHSVVVIPAGC